MGRKIRRWIRHTWRSIVELWAFCTNLISGSISRLSLALWVTAITAFVCGGLFARYPEIAIIVAIIVTLAMRFVLREYRRPPRESYFGRRTN
jgi:hypothetical protein